MMLTKPLYIFDLDGTLAYIDHRLHFINRERREKDWEGFYAACINDTPNTPVIRVMESLRLFADVWIFSGRSDNVRLQTVDWLVEHTSFARSDFDSALGTKDILTMRTEGDYTPDDELKLGWLRTMSNGDRKRLVAVFEDRQRVVDMWRKEGVTCFQVEPGQF